jgi:hypothetical protein
MVRTLNIISPLPSSLVRDVAQSKQIVQTDVHRGIKNSILKGYRKTKTPIKQSPKRCIGPVVAGRKYLACGGIVAWR